MKKFLLILGLVLGLSSSTDAIGSGLFSGGTSNPPPGTCPHASGGFPDGCAGADQTAQFIDPNFFSNVRQSGQGIYKTNAAITASYPVGWDAPGITYPVGQISPDANLAAASTISVSHCTYVAGPPAEVDCTEGAADKTISGYLFDDVAIDEAATTHTTFFINNHFIFGSNNCRRASSIIFFEHGTANTSLTNNTFENRETVCSFIANLFGTASDPGLTANTTGVANFSGTSMCYTSGPTTINSTAGIKLFQSAHFTGQINQNDFTSDNNPGGAPQIIASLGGGCYTLDMAQTTATGKTVTTGPQMSSNFGVIALSEIGNGTLTAKYNAIFGWDTMFSTATGGSTDIEFNYGKMYGHPRYHTNFIQTQPAPCDGGCSSADARTIPFDYEKYNTVWWPAVGAFSGTTTYGPFATSITANSAPPNGYQVTRADVNLSGNIAITNLTNNGYIGSPGAQTSANIRVTNQNGTPKATYTGTAVSGTMTVSGVTGTIAIGDQLLFRDTYNNISPVKITGGSGTTWTLNQSISFTGASIYDYSYSGLITSLTISGNATDGTGANGPYISLDVDVTYSSSSLTGNWNLLTGAACGTSSC